VANGQAFFDAYPETYDDITPTDTVTQFFNFAAVHSRPAIDERCASQAEVGNFEHWQREEMTTKARAISFLLTIYGFSAPSLLTRLNFDRYICSHGISCMPMFLDST